MSATTTEPVAGRARESIPSTGAAGAQAGPLRLPARAGVLRRRGDRADPARQRDPPDPEQLAYLINADLFTCGIASIIQTVGFWKIGVRLPLLQGVTFAAVIPMISIGLAQGGGVPG